MTDVEAETPILWPPDAKSWLIGKDPDAGKDWRQEEKGMIEDEMVGPHQRLNGHEFESTPGVGDGQGGLVCCSPWGRKESDTTESLNWTELNWDYKVCSIYWFITALYIDFTLFYEQDLCLLYLPSLLFLLIHILLFWFSIDAVKNYHKFSGLKSTNLSPLCRSKFQWIS